jgi:hypothetical protein
MKITRNGNVKSVLVRPIGLPVKPYKYSGDVNKKIATRAYEIFERRGKVPGHDVDDWLKAEAEVVWELH